MFLVELLGAVVIALILVGIFGVALRGEPVGIGLFWFFLVLLLAMWAGSLWLVPLGPPLFGVPWLSFLFVGIIFALLIMALLPPAAPRRPRTPGETREETEAEAGAFAALNVFFWILIVGLIIAIIAGYLF